MSGARIRLLYVGGYGRSGSTLLDRVLGATPGVLSLGEVRHLWREGLVENRRCGCGVPFRECPHWADVLRHAFPGGVDVRHVRDLQAAVDQWWRVPALARRRGSPELREYAGMLSALYGAAATATGAEVLVDSSKDVSHGWVLTHLADEIDVRTVHLVRDPRAVAHSWARHKHNPGSGRAMDTWPAWRTAVEWNVINAGVAGLRRRRPYLKVSYERLTSHPSGEIARILRFAGSTAAPAVGADGSVDLEPSHTAAGNPDRFRSGTTTIRPDARWQTDMAPRDRRLVSALCAMPLRGRSAAS